MSLYILCIEIPIVRFDSFASPKLKKLLIFIAAKTSLQLSSN